LPDSSFELSRELLDSINDHDIAPTFDACINAHGMYETMRFVLRLSPRNHELMEIIEANQFEAGSLPPEAIQAYSTYIHETVHWWQHVGSTSGLLFSLSYLAQVHSNMAELREVLNAFGPKKPLKAWTDQILLAEGHSAQEKLAPANIAVNNALDVEYYKAYAYAPRENIRWMIEQNHFESVGHTYFVVYSQLIGLISDVIDPECVAIPKTASWDEKISNLNSEKVEGYYWRSPVRLPAVGMRAIYEGQARFIQLQFLDGARKEPLTTADWRSMDYLSGIYVEAFEAFLKLSESEWPESMSDPLVGLFLLICDLAINPTRGVPLEIESFENFILDVDVGVRFTRLCLAAKELAHLKGAICKYTREEYIAASTKLTQLTGYDHPLTGCWTVKQWHNTAPGLNKLMEEYKTFDFDGINLPIRVFVSHFVAFCTDKYDHPEFFCWPGIHMSGGGDIVNAHEIWLRHLSLFSDRGDKAGVYPRRWPNRSEEAVKQTFQRFYSTMALYDLTRQWILKDGPFVCDYRWISENYNQDHANSWANDTMQKMYNVTLEDFEIIQ
jgi:hypothetical protein